MSEFSESFTFWADALNIEKFSLNYSFNNVQHIKKRFLLVCLNAEWAQNMSPTSGLLPAIIEFYSSFEHPYMNNYNLGEFVKSMKCFTHFEVQINVCKISQKKQQNMVYNFMLFVIAASIVVGKVRYAASQKVILLTRNLISHLV